MPAAAHGFYVLKMNNFTEGCFCFSCRQKRGCTTAVKLITLSYHIHPAVAQ